MESDAVSQVAKKWTKEEIIDLFRQGKTFEQVKSITGLRGRVLGGYKGLLKSPMYEGEPVELNEDGNGEKAPAGSQTQKGRVPSTQSGQNGGGKQSGATQLDDLSSALVAGPGEAQALSVLVGKPYLIRVQNVYVSPDALKCYQVLVARGFKGSVGDFFELCVLKTFKELYGLVPGMIRPEVQSQ